MTDENGEAMIGVSILEKGTTNGVVTDMEGNYRLRVRRGATLVFSYVGYITQELQVTGRRLNVTMKEDTETLEEVVVVGYGVQKKSNVTGAISKVDAEEMQNRTITSAQEALGGKTSWAARPPACSSLALPVLQATWLPSVSVAIPPTIRPIRFTLWMA